MNYFELESSSFLENSQPRMSGSNGAKRISATQRKRAYNRATQFDAMMALNAETIINIAGALKSPTIINRFSLT